MDEYIHCELFTGDRGTYPTNNKNNADAIKNTGNATKTTMTDNGQLHGYNNFHVSVSIFQLVKAIVVLASHSRPRPLRKVKTCRFYGSQVTTAPFPSW